MAAYTIVPGASEVRVRATSTVHAISGSVVEVQGSVDAEVDGASPRLVAGHVEVPIAALRSGNSLYDAELQRRIDARRYPNIVGQVRGVTPIGENGLMRVEGDVTFHGVTRPVEGRVLVQADGGRLSLEGEHVFDVRDFGVKPPRILVLRVDPEVTVRIRLVAEPA